MATLLEMATSIVSSHASVSEMSTDELLQEIQKVYLALQKLEGVTEGIIAEEGKPAMTLRKAFQADQVSCMICGKSGMKTLARHLSKEHGLKPGEYRKQFGIPSKQPLTARKFSEARRQMAQDRGLATNLAKARAVRAANLSAKKATPAKAAKVKVAKVAKVVKAAPKKKK